ncbi:hypothetical protein EG346_15845 [Chryseobacterium carnipullorum]|uniref:Uncharacterized protein n=1 Tax=Chryseobacterium carnipullorum TaxID=1124835 RepID=A0A3G6NF56_CHRCU|nr:hypothetical protein [Chryseobacterium carnipullorum]AZA49558.1 hypothetical protein EG346_15845 [Chryseobacterium carnipullorum]AZA64455.1 hypothetical protein EG345_06860 [Chryseobacterium carnipullorum]
MALFTKINKTTINSILLEIKIIEKFIQPVSEGSKEAVRIKMIGDDQKEYSLVFYEEDLQKCKAKLPENQKLHF